jgi:hypothetical protein
MEITTNRFPDQGALELARLSLELLDLVRGLDRLAPFLVRHTDHRAFGHHWMMAPRLFDLPRIDVLAAGNDHILLAVQDEKEAVVNDQTESLVCSQPSRFASMVANAVVSSAALPR